MYSVHLHVGYIRATSHLQLDASARTPPKCTVSCTNWTFQLSKRSHFYFDPSSFSIQDSNQTQLKTVQQTQHIHFSYVHVHVHVHVVYILPHLILSYFMLSYIFYVMLYFVLLHWKFCSLRCINYPHPTPVSYTCTCMWAYCSYRHHNTGVARSEVTCSRTHLHTYRSC